jgi:hypothetical protein
MRHVPFDGIHGDEFRQASFRRVPIAVRELERQFGFAQAMTFTKQ